MKYDDVRDQIQTGDLLAWTHKGWKSWYDFKIQMVRMFTQSEYSHVGLAWVVAGRVFILESVVPKVRIYPLSKELPFYWMPMKKPLSKEAEEFAMAQVGEPYSQIRAILAYFKLVKPNDQNKWECAEYAAKVLRENGIDLGDTYTPSAVVEAGMKLGYDLKLVQ
jgi:hypothetical protein